MILKTLPLSCRRACQALAAVGTLIFTVTPTGIAQAEPGRGVHSLPSAAAMGGKPDLSPTGLREIARQTWNYFVSATQNATGLPDDRIDITGTNTQGRQETHAQKTSPTNIGLYLMAIASAYDLGLITRQQADARLAKVISSLNKLAVWHGFPYNWYDTTDGSVIGNRFVSTVDDGWYTAGLIVARQAFPEYRQAFTKLIQAMNYHRLYDARTSQLFGGYDQDKHAYTDWDYGNLNTESRVADYVAIGKNDVPSTLWWHLYRTLPADWTWQLQKPSGPVRTYQGVPVTEGHYHLGNVKFVPSWGGSMFEALMPTLVLDEVRLAPHALGLNDRRMIDLQISYALKTKKYPVWGISPCALPGDGYGVFGVPGLGCTKYEENGVITPHATFLALPLAPQAALKNLSTMLKRYPIIGKYGFYDSVNVRTAQVTTAYLALDEGMILVSLDNYLLHGKIRQYFNNDPIGKRPQPLLSQERFSIE